MALEGRLHIASSAWQWIRSGMMVCVRFPLQGASTTITSTVNTSYSNATSEVEVFEYQILARQPFHQLLPQRCAGAKVVLLHPTVEIKILLPQPSLL